MRTFASSAVALGLVLLVYGTARADHDGEDNHVHVESVEWLILSAELGYRAFDLRRIRFDGDGISSAQLTTEAVGGVTPGIAAGVRLWFLSILLRGDVTFLQGSGSLDGSELWNLDLELDLRLFQGRLQPYLWLAFGYAALGGIDDLFDQVRLAGNANGLNFKGGPGLDWYFAKRCTLGLRVDIGVQLLASKVSAGDLLEPEEVDTLGETEARLAEADGSLVGLSYGIALAFGWHLP